MQQLTTDLAQVHSQLANTMEWEQRLLTRITERCARVGVVGLGYVGLPLAIGWARSGFLVTGIDVDQLRVDMCLQSKSWITDVQSEDLGAMIREGQLTATSDTSLFSELDVIIICVPTPLNEAKQPDIGAILTVVDAIAACATLSIRTAFRAMIEHLAVLLQVLQVCRYNLKKLRCLGIN